MSVGQQAPSSKQQNYAGCEHPDPGSQPLRSSWPNHKPSCRRDRCDPLQQGFHEIIDPHGGRCFRHKSESCCRAFRCFDTERSPPRSTSIKADFSARIMADPCGVAIAQDFQASLSCSACHDTIEKPSSRADFIVLHNCHQRIIPAPSILL